MFWSEVGTASAEIGFKSRKGLILKLYDPKSADPPKKTRLGQILHTAMAKIFENGAEKRLNDVYYGLKKISVKTDHG